MARQGQNVKLHRIVTFYIAFILTFGGLFVLEPFLEEHGMPDFSEDAAAAPMAVFSDDMDPVQPGWDNTRVIGPDGEPRDGQPGFNPGNEWAVSSVDAYSPPNSWYSGPEELGVDTFPPWEPFGHVRPLYTPSIDLRNASSAELTFWHKYDFLEVTDTDVDGGVWTWYGDGGMVFATADDGWTWDYLEPEEEYSGMVGFNPSWVHNMNPPFYGNNPFSPLLRLFFGPSPPFPPTPDLQEGGGAYVGDSGGWTPANFNLDEYCGREIKIVFAYTQNYKLEANDGNSDGYGDFIEPWYIDDVVVTKEPIDGPSIQVVGTDSVIINQTETYSFVLNVTNWKNVGDWINLNLVSILGWAVQILNYTTYQPLTGDIWLDSQQWTLIRVNVTVPVGAPWGAGEISTALATSVSDPMKSSVANLYTSAPSPDVGVEWITIPPDRPPGNPIDITARIKNYGTISVSFPVQCTVEGDLLIQPPVYNESGSPSQFNYISDLPPGGEVDLSWNFTPQIASPYETTVTTLLNIDLFPGNNESSGICYVQSSFWTWNDIPDGDDNSSFTTYTNVATEWEWGPPTMGPGTAYEGANAWGTDLDANYADGVHAVLHTPWFNFTKATTVTVTFAHWYETDTQGNPANRDRVYFGYNLPTDTDDVVNIINVPGSNAGDGGWEGDSGTWSDPQITVDVTGSAAGISQIRFSWLMKDRGTASGGSDAGYYIDNITIFASLPEADLVITEIIDNDGIGNEYIEVFNQGNTNAILGDYEISLDGGTTWISGTWMNQTGIITLLEPGQHGWFVPAGLDRLDDEGASIMLVNTSLPGGQGYIHDDIGYGQEGLVPDPVTGESVARFWNGVIYTDDWARETATSMGYPHFGNGSVYNPLVVLNEIYFNASTGERFIELIYAGRSGDPEVDIDGWVVVVDGNPFTISSAGQQSTVMNSTHTLYVINDTMAPSLFAEMTASGDNVYLYNTTGSLVDQVGWDTTHPADSAIARVPDGFGITIGFERFAVDGYSDETSMDAGWQFIGTPTMGIVSLERDQKKVGDTGETVTYTLTLMNHGFSDIIDLSNLTTGEGWVVEIYAADGTTLLVDTNGNGVPDTGLLAPNGIVTIIVKIYIPYHNPGDRMDTTVTATPEGSPFGKDVVTLVTETYPHLEINKSISIDEIWLNGSSASYTPQEATITLSVRGGGLTQFVTYPQDVVFVIDKSGSMATSDPTGLRIDAAKNYVDNMTLPDRAAVVAYDDYAFLVDGPDDVPPNGDNEHTVWDLSSQYQDIKDNIDECNIAAGLTSTGWGLEVAVDQMIANGNASQVQAIILTTDGMAFDPALAYQQAKRARDNGILIFVIFLDVTGWLEGWWLEHFLANTTGGVYFPTADPAAIQSIYHEIGAFITEIAGRDIVVGDANYLVQDVLPPDIDYVPGTFTVIPDSIVENGTGYTFLGWEKQQISINETWVCKFNIRANMPGYQMTNDYQSSRVNYTKWNNETIEDYFPVVWVNVFSPMPDPPVLRIIHDGTKAILDWTPPGMPDVSHYLIYRSSDRDSFDFSSPWVNTSDPVTGIDPVWPGFPVGERTTWNDTVALSPESYYLVRTVNIEGVISFTSNTVGVYEKTLPAGSSTFSLPLAPSYGRNASWYMQQMGSLPADYIKWCDPGTQTWVKHYIGDGDGVNDTQLDVGSGYEINLANPTTYAFWGMPASSLRFLEDELPRPGSFALSVIGNDVSLGWDQVPGADHYVIYRATTRWGINNRLLSSAGETTAFGPNAWTDLDPQTNVGGNEFYYAVGAVNSSLEHVSFNTTYSIGIWIANFPGGYSAIGLPVRTFDSVTKTVDQYVDDIPNAVGLNYFIYGEQRWAWHRFNMPMGVYDEVMGYSNGYQLSTSALSNYYFVGR